MPKKILTDQQLLELTQLLMQKMHVDDWDRWITFQLCRETPSLPTWRWLIFGDSEELKLTSQGALSRYIELSRPACAGNYLYELSKTFVRLASGANGYAPYDVMYGQWRFSFYPMSSDIPYRRWCHISFGMRTLQNIENKNTPPSALFDVLIAVWNSEDYPDSARLLARALACSYLTKLIANIKDTIPLPTPTAA